VSSPQAKPAMGRSSRGGVGRWLLILSTVVATVLVAAPQASAGKGIIGHFGSEGTGAGAFSDLRSIAVNSSGAGAGAEPGDVYVADSFFETSTTAPAWDSSPG